jgi:hypothetical protein
MVPTGFLYQGDQKSIDLRQIVELLYHDFPLALG